MKNILRLAVVVLILAAVSNAWATGACVLTDTERGRLSVSGEVERVYVTLTCTSDAAGIAAYTLTPSTFNVRFWYLYSVTTDPDGTSAPTNAYDITLLATGEDIAGGLLADRSSTARQTVVIAPTTLGYHVGDGALAVTFANITSNPGILVMTLRFTRN